MSDKFGDGRDPYLYPGLNIMRNRLGIRQVQRLEQAAYELTALRAATIEAGPLVSIYIREIPVFAILPTSKKRVTP